MGFQNFQPQERQWSRAQGHTQCKTTCSICMGSQRCTEARAERKERDGCSPGSLHTLLRLTNTCVDTHVPCERQGTQRHCGARQRQREANRGWSPPGRSSAGLPINSERAATPLQQLSTFLVLGAPKSRRAAAEQPPLRRAASPAAATAAVGAKQRRAGAVGGSDVPRVGGDGRQKTNGIWGGGRSGRYFLWKYFLPKPSAERFGTTLQHCSNSSRYTSVQY